MLEDRFLRHVCTRTYTRTLSYIHIDRLKEREEEKWEWEKETSKKKIMKYTEYL